VYGQPVTGIIAQTGDYQDWTFTGQAGDVITIRGVQNGGASLAPGIKLLDPSGSLVADAAGDATNDVTAIIMNYSLRFSGVYTIRVYGFAGYGSNYSTGGYQLSLIKK
jgi:hypothetical protein